LKKREEIWIKKGKLVEKNNVKLDEKKKENWFKKKGKSV